MHRANRATRFAKHLLQTLPLALRAVDSMLVSLAGLFGTTVVRSGLRYGRFVGVFVAIYAAAMLQLVWPALAALGLGYLGVLAVGRAWVRNEQQRAAIAKKLSDDDPDALPDLRGLALLSALQLFVLFPLIFWHVQREFRLYDAPHDAPFWVWVGFTFDSVCKAVFDWSEVYEIHFTSVGYVSTWGRHLMMLKRLTFDFVLIQGVIRILALRTTIREAVDAVSRDPDLSVRLGRRSIPRLVEKLSDPNCDVRVGAAVALGTLGDHRAVEPLIEGLAGKSSGSAAIALGRLSDVRAVVPLISTLEHPSVWVRKCAAEALGEIGDVRALVSLIDLQGRDENEHVRKAAGTAVRKIAPPSAAAAAA